MARRGRGSTARTKAAPNGRAVAPDPAVHPAEPGDEPGARTIGAMALKRWAARGPGRGDPDDDGGAGLPTHGPFDEDDAAHAPEALERVDFGAVRVPVPRGGEVSVEPEDGRLQAVHVMLPAGRLSVSALAAPRTERLWPDLAAEIDESLREGGATVRSFTGEWGRELHARTGDASSLFLGVDGPRWMLYGVATGPTSAAAELDAALRAMLRGTVVVRGRAPYPVRTVLPLSVPDELPRPGLAHERVPVPRMPAERVPAPARPAPSVDAPTMITPVADGDTVPHGIPPVPAAGRNGSARPAPAPAEPGPDVADAASDGAIDSANTETAVSRTVSRGLFRRRTERPPARSPQRRVSDLIAEAERDRTAPPRDDSPAPAPPPERRPSNGHEVGGPRTNGLRTNGYVPPEPTVGEPVDGLPVNGSYGGGFPLDEAPVDRGPGGGSPFDAPRANGSHGPGAYGDESSGPVWPAANDAGEWYGAPGAGGGVLPDRWSDDWSPDHHLLPIGGSAGYGAGPELGGHADDDVEATVWASMIRGEPRPSSTIAADGSDDWTLPLPVVRPEPEPEQPPRPPAVPGGRRARREAEERAAEHRAAGHRAPERGGPDRWTPEPWTPQTWTPQTWTPEPDTWDGGAHSAAGPRHGGHERGPAADDRPSRASRRSARTRARHADEHDAGSHADRARHRRPDR
jgi:hypothetical protein